MVRQQQRGLPGVVAVSALLYAARPAALEIRGDPPALARRCVEPEVRPRMTAPRVLQDSSPFTQDREGSSETTAIIALPFALACSLDPERLTGPQLAPPLA